MTENTNSSPQGTYRQTKELAGTTEYLPHAITGLTEDVLQAHGKGHGPVYVMDACQRD